MSPLWRDEIGLYLSPQRICLVRLGRGLRPKLVAELEESVEPEIPGHWSAALGRAAELLSTRPWQGAGLKVVVADCWVRYAVVPWVPDLKSALERTAHARQVLASIYGDVVRDWEVRLSEAPPQQSRIACTLPAELLEGIRLLTPQNKPKLLSVQTQLIAAYAAWRQRLPESGAWLVTVGEGFLAAAHMGELGWDRVHSVRTGTDWIREVSRLQTFSRLSSGSPDGGKVYVDAPLAWREVAGSAGRELSWLEEDSSILNTLQRLGRVRRLAA